VAACAAAGVIPASSATVIGFTGGLIR
jgi:hypothetical protein